MEKYTDTFSYKAELYHTIKYTLSHLDKLIHYFKIDKNNKDIQKCIDICFEKIKKELDNTNIQTDEII